MAERSQHKVLFVATLVRNHIAKFHVPYLKYFKEQGWETWVAAKNDYPDGVCEIPYCDTYVDIPFDRNPFAGSNLQAYRELKRLIDSEQFDLVHTHTPVGGALGRMAARKARKHNTVVFYTAHGFHFYTGAPLSYWVCWYPLEKLFSRATDVLITINQEDYARAQKFATCTVAYLPGVGVDEAALLEQANRSVDLSALGISEDASILLSVGDLIPRKNIGVSIQALALLKEKYHLVVCGDGKDYDKLCRLTRELGVERRVHFLGYRNDVPALMKKSFALVFPSIQEGLPVAVLEAMALGTPVVASKIRGVSPDLIEDGKDGLLLEHIDAQSVAAAIERLESNPQYKDEMVAQAHSAAEPHSLAKVLTLFDNLVQSALKDKARVSRGVAA